MDALILLVIPAKAGIQVAVPKAKMDSNFRRNDDESGRRTHRAIGFAAVRSGIPGSSPGRALPSQSGLRRNHEKTWKPLFCSSSGRKPGSKLLSHAKVKMDSGFRRNDDERGRRTHRATGFADVRFGIPGSSPGQALPSQSGLRRSDEKTWKP